MPMAPDPLRGPVVVLGADSALGRQAVDLLRKEVGDDGVVPVACGGPGRIAPDGARRADLVTADLRPLLTGASTVVLLHSDAAARLADERPSASSDDVVAAGRVLAAATDEGVTHLVVLSSATVYGAWSNNPLPLAEDATLRPCPDLAFAVERAEIERRVAEWRAATPEATATVLRPAPVVGDVATGDDDTWLASALHAARRVADLEGDPPAQFLHLDDLASAVALAVSARLDGARNVAPDGWLRGAEYAALADAGVPRLRVPRRVGDRVSRLRWRLRLAPSAPGILPYARGPWVVANDRLRADGWRPLHANDEAFVDGTPATALATLSPRRRQEIALGVTGGALVAAAVGVGWAVARRARRG
jgi:nucleoside-diphosphate-sugar epimerase